MDEQRQAALQEFGFRCVPTTAPGSPTPGRIADRIHDIKASLEDAIEARSWERCTAATVELRRLLFTLDCYDGGMMAQREGGK